MHILFHNYHNYTNVKLPCLGLARTVYIHRISGDFPDKSTVYTPYIYMVMANPNHAMYNHVSHIFHIISQIPIIPRVGQNRIYTPYIWWFPCQKHRIYTIYIWLWPTLTMPCITMYPTYSTLYPRYPSYLGLARTVYIHRIFGDFPAKNTVYTPYIYGSGQP